MALSLTPQNGKATLGVASISAQTEVNNDTRTVYLHDLKVTSIRFPSLDAQATGSMETLLQSLVPTDPEPIARDRLMADLDRNKVAAPACSSLVWRRELLSHTGPDTTIRLMSNGALAFRIRSIVRGRRPTRQALPTTRGREGGPPGVPCMVPMGGGFLCLV